MPFDINQKLVDEESGEALEEQSGPYFEQLLDLFATSPEGQTLLEAGFELSWTYPFLDYGLGYLGATPPTLSLDQLDEILFEIFPRKVSVPAEAAPEIIRELAAFFTFLAREFKLPNAAQCLQVLDERATRRLAKELANPANFGMAKAFVMQGQQQGFDISSEEGLNQWMLAYNAHSALGAASPKGGLLATLPIGPVAKQKSPSGLKAQNKAKRKMAKQSRRKNRK